jgi:hypothetical protein
MKKLNTINQNGSIIAALSIIILGVLSLYISKEQLRFTKYDTILAVDKAPLYLPDAKYVRLITFGFDNMVSNIIWFSTINYFGKQYTGSKDYRWLYNMCDLVTELDANKEHAYEFCGTLLSWEAREVELSNKILTKGINSHPQKWRYRYLRAFNYWYFLEEKDMAREDLEYASQLKDAPIFLSTMASRFLIDAGSIDTAITFLEDILHNTEDKYAKRSIRDKLKRAYLTKHIRYLNEKIEQYEMTFGHKPMSISDLKERGIIKAIPKEPFKGNYYIDSESGEVKTTSKKKALELADLSASTGIARHEMISE